MATISPQFEWMVVGRRHAYRMAGKRCRGEKSLSKDPLNLTGKNSFRQCSFLSHKGLVAVRENKDKTDIELVTKVDANKLKPAEYYNVVSLEDKAPRDKLVDIQQASIDQKRPKMRMVAMRKAVALLKAQKRAEEPATMK